MSDEAATETKRLGFVLLCEKPLSLDGPGLEAALCAYDAELATASVKLDGQTAEQGTPMGVVRWRAHTVELVGFDAPMPAAVLDPLLRLSHYDPKRKKQAAEHQAHVICREESDAAPLERYAALAAICGALSGPGVLAVVHEAAQTTLPAGVFEKTEDSMLEFLRNLPLPMLYCGFAKYEVAGTDGVWMRTWAAHTMGLPDLAYLGGSHGDAEPTWEIFEDILRYVLQTEAELAEGHTLELEDDVFVRLRAPQQPEYFLESPGPLWVIERIEKDEAGS